MKRFLAILCALTLIFSLAGCIVVETPTEDADAPTAENSTTTTPEVSTPVATPEYEIQENPEDSDYAAEITGYALGKNYEDKDCLIVYITWTNNSNETCAYYTALNAYAYQNGIELESSFPSSISNDENAYEIYENGQLELRPGASINVAEYFILRDPANINDIEVEVHDWISWEEIIVTGGITSGF